MAHRQEQKEQRRQERLEREQAEAKAAARRKRLQYLVGGLLALAAVAGVIVLLVVGVGGGSDEEGGQPVDPSEAAAAVELPTQQSGDLKGAAKAAGCKLTNPEIEGSTHETKEFAPTDFKTNPPTSGNHKPDWYDDGIYPPGGTPDLGKLVHTLEHGRINLQYKEGTSSDDVLKLEALFAEQSEGYHMLLYQNTTGMDAAVAATAWGHSLTCPAMNDKVYDAVRTFRSSYIDKGPEAVP